MRLGRESFEAAARNALRRVYPKGAEPSDEAVIYVADVIGRIYSIGLHDGKNNKSLSMPCRRTPERPGDEEELIVRSYN